MNGINKYEYNPLFYAIFEGLRVFAKSGLIGNLVKDCCALSRCAYFRDAYTRKFTVLAWTIQMGTGISEISFAMTWIFQGNFPGLNLQAAFYRFTKNRKRLQILQHTKTLQTEMKNKKKSKMF